MTEIAVEKVEEMEEKVDPNAWLEEITCDLGLRQHLDFAIAKANESYVKSKNPSWYPSDLGKDLYTRLIKRKGLDALPFNARTLRKFEIGKLWEKRLHEVLDARIARKEANIKELDLWMDQKEPFNKRVANEELELRGFYDRMLLTKISDTEWAIVVYEIKSVASTSFHHQKKEGEQPLGNRMQMMFYLERIQAEFPRLKAYCESKYEISPTKVIGVLSQVSKDDGSMWERTYEFDPVLFQKIVDEITELNKHWKAGTMPDKPTLILVEDGIAKVNWEVSYSSYVHHIIGNNYVAVLKVAEQLVRKHYYYRKKNPTKVGIIEEQIKEFNAKYR